MSEFFTEMSEKHQQWIAKQHMFFVASAPLSQDQHVNVSPKGLDTLRILSASKVAYLDVTGSGNETSAHIRENGRITFMFCAFEGPPRIMRLYGIGRTVLPGTAEWDELIPQFDMIPGARQIVVADISECMTSCGFAVPFYDYVGQRDTLIKWAEHHEDGIEEYRAQANRLSIDGLPTALHDVLPEPENAQTIKL